MSNFNPFNNDTEDTSFEQGTPVTQAAKTVSKAVQAQADDAIKQANDAVVAALYGPSDHQGQDQGTDEANTQHSDTSNAATRMASTHAGVSQTAKVNPNQTPEEEAKMEKIRHELFGNYSIQFKSAQNASGVNSASIGLDQEMDKARKEREQKEMQRKQEEEEEEKRKKEEEEQAKQEFLAPPGKNGGRNRMGEPIALTKAKTKVEISRGTDG